MSQLKPLQTHTAYFAEAHGTIMRGMYVFLIGTTTIQIIRITSSAFVVSHPFHLTRARILSADLSTQTVILKASAGSPCPLRANI